VLKLSEEVALLQTKRAQSKDTVIAIMVLIGLLSLLVSLAVFFLQQSKDVNSSESIQSSTSWTDNKQTQKSKPDADNANNEIRKLNFENNLTRYTQEFKLKIDALKSLRWSSGEALNIAQMEQDALTAYGSQYYIEADKMIDDILKRSADLLEQQSDEFTKLSMAHNAALSQGRVAEAQRLLTVIKQVAPNHSDVVTLEKYTEDLPMALQRQAKFRQFASKDQYQQALDLVGELIALQPYNSEWNEQEQKLEGLVRERSIAAVIGRFHELIDNKRFDQARKLLSESQAIGISASQLHAFEKRIENGRRVQALATLVENANEAEKKDSWTAAIRYYREALALDKTNAGVAEKLQLAEAVASASEGVQTLINRPLALSDKSVGAYADNRLRAARELQLKSPSLKSQADKLGDLLRLARIKRSVQVVSDGKTRIEVQTIGFIEPTKGKEIQLYPGKYLLFAKCKNSKDRVVELIVPLQDQVPISRVECGERI